MFRGTVTWVADSLTGKFSPGLCWELGLSLIAESSLFSCFKLPHKRDIYISYFPVLQSTSGVASILLQLRSKQTRRPEGVRAEPRALVAIIAASLILGWNFGASVSRQTLSLTSIRRLTTISKRSDSWSCFLGSSPPRFAYASKSPNFTNDQTPIFEAVPYTWGLADNPVNIFIGQSGNRTLSVTQNLAEALPYFRFEDRPRVLWGWCDMCVSTKSQWEGASSQENGRYIF
jgi:hypothetical protein